jgi:hypothetical protein
MKNLSSENALTLHVDMVTRTAKLYNKNSRGSTRGKLPGEKLEACHVWENLPPRVWVAAFALFSLGRPGDSLIVYCRFAVFFPVDMAVCTTTKRV